MSESQERSSISQDSFTKYKDYHYSRIVFPTLVSFLHKIDASLLNQMELFVKRHQDKEIYIRHRSEKVNIYEDILFISATKRHQDLLDKRENIEVIWKQLSKRTGRSLVTITDRLTKRICRLHVEEIRSYMEKKENIPSRKLVGLHSKASQPSAVKKEKNNHTTSKMRQFSVGDGSPRIIVSRVGAAGLRNITLSEALKNYKQENSTSQYQFDQTSFKSRKSIKFSRKQFDGLDEPGESSHGSYSTQQITQLKKVTSTLKERLSQLDEDLYREEQKLSRGKRPYNQEKDHLVDRQFLKAHVIEPINNQIMNEFKIEGDQSFGQVFVKREQHEEEANAHEVAVAKKEEPPQQQPKLQPQPKEDLAIHIQSQIIVKKEENIQHHWDQSQNKQTDANLIYSGSKVVESNDSSKTFSQILHTFGQRIGNEREEQTALMPSEAVSQPAPSNNQGTFDQLLTTFLQFKINRLIAQDYENEQDTPWTEDEDKIILRFAETKDNALQLKFSEIVKRKSLRAVINRIKTIQERPGGEIFAFIKIAQLSLQLNY